jgi:hypothetical protein
MSCCTRLGISLRRVCLALVVVTVSGRVASAQQFRRVDDGPIHEAFVPAITGISALEAIPKQPPPPIVERPPASCDPQAIWIRGYWDYDEDSDDFQWVGGCWRRPPSGQHWIEGFWQRFDEGYVWIRGFWSPVPVRDLNYIDDAPPDAPDEDAPNPIGANYFWLGGYWGYQPGQGYVQYAGRWIEMDPNFVLVPATYHWRPDGYVFTPAYWDWPLDRRGCTYPTVYLEPAARVADVVYEPVVAVEPTVVIGWCYSYYPNYTYFVHHHYHHHHDWWYDHYDVPTWWGWNGWWSLSWHNHWGVWWWWSHPGYPHPGFMSAAYASHIAPPYQKNVFKVKNVYAPRIVTVNGVVTPKETLKLSKTKNAKGGIAPVVAATTKERLDGKDFTRDGDRKGDRNDRDRDGDGKRDRDGDGKRDGNNKVIAKGDTLLPTGNKSAKDAKDDRDDLKNVSPKVSNKQPNLRDSTRGTGGNVLGAGAGKGNDFDGDKNRKGNSPPITVKGNTRDGDGKPGKGGLDEKPDKTGDKSRPPIIQQGQGGPSKDKDKDKDKDKPKGREEMKPARPPIVPSTGDKPKGDRDSDKGKDKEKDKDKQGDSGKRGGGGGGSVNIDTKPKNSGGGGGAPPVDVKPKEKPPTSGGGGGGGGGGAGGGGGGKGGGGGGGGGGNRDGDKGDKEKDKDKKKDKNR